MNPVRVLYVSPALEHIWGIAPTELYQNPRAWEPHVYAPDRARVYQAWDKACDPAVTNGFEIEYRIVHADGSIRWLSDVLTPVRSDTGGGTRLCGVSRDITVQKRLERALLDATDCERRRLGHDLHDGLGQELTAISMMAGAIASKARKSEYPSAEEIERIAELTRHAIATCRSIARGLSPLGFAAGGLIGALQAMAKLQHDAPGAALRFEAIAAAPLRLAPDACDHLYRIAQEAVTNARRHSRARLINVTLDVQPNAIRLEVLDDGAGQSNFSGASAGMGLRIMQYRASMIGARLSIGPGEHGGTLVTCECAQPVEGFAADTLSPPASFHDHRCSCTGCLQEEVRDRNDGHVASASPVDLPQS